jgi:hypothetical protein
MQYNAIYNTEAPGMPDDERRPKRGLGARGEREREREREKRERREREYRESM